MPITVGQRFGRWTAVRPALTPRYWVCRCDCGRERSVYVASLLKGVSTSCRCRSSEVTAARNRTHGLSSRPEYEVWASMKKRCYNPRFQQFADYGGRGITVCDRWRTSFPLFLADLGERPSPQHSLDRINNDGPYAPENCRWVVKAWQAGNKRNNRLLTFRGETQTLAEWSRRCGFQTHLVILKRLQRGWSLERALTTPAR